MKKDIHPQYTIIKANCACGHTFKVGSTLDKIEVEVCSNCHPFYTGEEKIIDTAGRVEKFKTRRKAGEEAKIEADKKAKKKKAEKAKAKKEEKKEETKEETKEVKKKPAKKKEVKKATPKK